MTFKEFQVERTAELLPSNVTPLYPEQLRTANVEGSVVAQFVVDTTGEPMAPTVRVIERSDDRFVASVRETIPKLRFSPAEVGGKKVKQLVQMPFTFRLPQGATDGAGVVTFKAVQLAPNGGPGSRGAGGPKPTTANTVYLEYQVEVPATPVPNNRAPRYPAELRSANIEGEVLAQFIVDESGRADSSSLQVVRSTNEGFANAVRSSVSSFRFSPALVGGRPVKQLVQMPFQFNLSK